MNPTTPAAPAVPLAEAASLFVDPLGSAFYLYSETEALNLALNGPGWVETAAPAEESLTPASPGVFAILCPSLDAELLPRYRAAAIAADAAADPGADPAAVPAADKYYRVFNHGKGRFSGRFSVNRTNPDGSFKNQEVYWYPDEAAATRAAQALIDDDTGDSIPARLLPGVGRF